MRVRCIMGLAAAAASAGTRAAPRCAGTLLHSYRQEGRWRQGSPGSKRVSRGQQMSYAHACLHTHFLAGEERFRVEWHADDDSVW